MDGPIIGCVRISEWPFDSWWQFRPNLGPTNNFWLDSSIILWFLWDLGLTLLIIAKDAVFAEILVFSNIFVFSAVNWAPTLAAFHLSQNS